jgi:ornithine cyclodeaminase
MAKVIPLEIIRGIVPRLDLVNLMEEGFVAYSAGRAVVPPVGELIFEDPPGETHIKYGYIRGGDYYVIKIASGFYENPKLGLAPGEGLMLLFSQKTGLLETVLLDRAYLTDVRTAAAGAVAAKHLAPSAVRRIGILGGGVQARLQLDHLLPLIPCRQVLVWMRNPEATESYRQSFADSDLEIEFASDPDAVAEACNLIVTTTPAKQPLLCADAIRPGTHITAMGSDTEDKLELEPDVLARADVVVVDSLPQSESRGEVFQAVKAGVLDRDVVVELGAVIAGAAEGRTDDQQVTICDLTGVAVQDLMIAQGVLEQVRLDSELPVA